MSGRGRVYSYTVAHHAALPALAGDVPYIVVVVELEDAPGARIISNLVGTPIDGVAIGMPVCVSWDEPRPGTLLPRFRAA